MIVLAIFCLLTAGILGGLYVGHALGYEEGQQDYADRFDEAWERWERRQWPEDWS